MPVHGFSHRKDPNEFGDVAFRLSQPAIRIPGKPVSQPWHPSKAIRSSPAASTWVLTV